VLQFRVASRVSEERAADAADAAACADSLLRTAAEDGGVTLDVPRSTGESGVVSSVFRRRAAAVVRAVCRRMTDGRSQL